MKTKLVFLLTKLLSSTNIAILVFLISMMQLQHRFSSIEEETKNNPPGFKSIKKFDSDGKFITSWGSEGDDDGEFLHAHGIAIDSSSGNVYVSDDDKNSIQKFTSDGQFITSWGPEGTGDGQFLRPEAVAIDSSSGNVYVADFEGNNIQKFDSDGNFITKWGSKGDGEGEFQRPWGVTVDSLEMFTQQKKLATGFKN